MLTLVSELRKLGYEVEVLTGVHGSAEQVEMEYGVKAHYIKTCNWVVSIDKRNALRTHIKNSIKKIYNLYSEIENYGYIKKFAPDIVVINSSDRYVGIKSCHFLGIPVVMHFREFMTLDHGICYCSERMAYRYFSMLDGGIAISKDIKDYFMRYPIPELKVIYNGIDIQKYKSHVTERKKGCFEVSCVGRVCEGKNQKLALMAAKQLSEKGYNFHITFCGECIGGYIDELKQYVFSEKLDRYVTFAGAVSDMKKVYAHSHINLLCSKNEAFGRVIIEGMVNKCLCIVPNSGGAKEIIKDRYNGLLFESNSVESLCSVLAYAFENYESLKRVISQGSADAENIYSARGNAVAVAEYLEAVYENKERFGIAEEVK